MCVWRGHTRLVEEPQCWSLCPAKGSVCGQRTVSPMAVLLLPREDLPSSKPDAGSREGSSTVSTCLAGSPHPAGRAGTSAGEGAGPTVLARHPAESCETKHEHSVTEQLWQSRAPSPATVDACTHMEHNTHTAKHTPASARGQDALLFQPQSNGAELCMGHRMGGMNRTFVLQPLTGSRRPWAAPGTAL